MQLLSNLLNLELNLDLNLEPGTESGTVWHLITIIYTCSSARHLNINPLHDLQISPAISLLTSLQTLINALVL